VSSDDPAAAAGREKRLAAEAAAELVRDGDRVGLGTGSTATLLVEALARRNVKNLRCVATSVATERLARELGLAVEPFDSLDELEIAIDGADQIDPANWLIKGGGAAHTREKVVAGAAKRFVVIASADKVVEALTPPVPLELLAYGLPATLKRLQPARRRDVPPSPDGNVIADFLGDVGDPAALAARLSATPGLVEHGLFAPALVGDVLIGRGDGVEHRR
jgi:ribose 5-phosphate isomerase A